MNNNPKELGFKMPAEWENHEAVWLAWPHDKITFPNRLEKVEEKFIEIIKAMEGSEIVKLLVLNNEMQTKVENLLKNAGVNISGVIFYITDYADVWLRDYGPMFIKNNKTKTMALVKWNYNAYGGKFPDLLKDNEVFLDLEEIKDKKKFGSDIFMEGGAIEINGEGVLVTTEQCLLNPNRNPDLKIDQIEQSLKDNLGIDKIIWLKEGIVNDHTDGHVDDIIKFVNANTIVCAYEEDITDPNFKILNDNYKILEKSTDQNGKFFNLIKIPMPHMNYEDGLKAPASYANFYIGNKVVLVPTFNDLNDEKALSIIQSCFTDKKIVGIDCRDIIYGGGALHCVTQQEPAI